MIICQRFHISLVHRFFIRTHDFSWHKTLTQCMCMIMAGTGCHVLGNYIRSGQMQIQPIMEAPLRSHDTHYDLQICDKQGVMAKCEA